ncbi:hypothetical protein ABW21_db0206400 [Orbilia brochopaga]|nr:hypothetical protein ABW21_db0206400 [Drechslerella brochopaga]
MSSEALREATASERLTLPEEYAMQKSWREDVDKLTFILSLPSPRIQEALSQSPTDSPGASKDKLKVIEGSDDTSDRLIGDINLFLYEDNDDLEEGEASTGMVGEIEVMIARPEYQGQGLGKVTVLVFMVYILRHQEQILAQDSSRFLTTGGERLKHLRVKIGKDNMRSLVLFQKLGFRKCTEEANVFGEFELRLAIEPREDVEANLRIALTNSGVDQLEEAYFQSMGVSETT